MARQRKIHSSRVFAADFPDTEAIYLEQNYRSTGAILAASLAVVSQGNSAALTLTLQALTHDRTLPQTKSG